MKLIRDGEKGGREGGGMGVGGRGGGSVPIATLSPPEQAAMRARLVFH